MPEVETVTGEEAESNVMQINCKLFLFDDVSCRFVIRISRRDLNPRQLCHQHHGALNNDYTSIALVIYFTISYFLEFLRILAKISHANLVNAIAIDVGIMYFTGLTPVLVVLIRMTWIYPRGGKY